MNAARKLCPAPGCNTITIGGRCPKHKSTQHQGTSRNRSGDPFYSSKLWKRLRMAKLRDCPICECDDCKRTGAIVAADRVDHIKPRAEHPELEYEWANLASLSESHHNRKTARERHAKRQATKHTI